jgi:hypothetical protein
VLASRAGHGWRGKVSKRKTSMLFKCTGKNDQTGYRWPLPYDGEPGDWTPVIENIELCERGYRLAQDVQVLGWLDEEVYIAEARPGTQRIDSHDKITVSSARLVRRLDRWDKRGARLFACWCVEQVLPIFEHEYPDDPRPRQAIGVTRRFVSGEATREELAAARNAVRDMVRAAVDATAGTDVEDAVRAAVDVTVSAAARDTALAAAGIAARVAIETAVWVTTLAAPRVNAAGDAVGAAAWSATRFADNNHATDAARAAQFKKFCEMFVD